MIEVAAQEGLHQVGGLVGLLGQCYGGTLLGGRGSFRKGVAKFWVVVELHGEVVGVPVHGQHVGACDALLQSGIFWGVVQMLSAFWLYWQLGGGRVGEILFLLRQEVKLAAWI